jgi:hypothetical protein
VLEARLALEKFKAPRPLSREQIESIARKLPSLEMNSVAIGVNPATSETVALTEQIAAILSLAEFSPNINNGFTTNTLGVFKGVIRPLNRHVERVLKTSRKDTHEGKRKLKREM